MRIEQRFISEQFPRSSAYNPDWVLASVSGGASALWLTEWLTSALELRPGLKVLDLGCGRAASSIFLQREFGVQVWAADLWYSAAENAERIRDVGLESHIIPLQAEARSLPFAPAFFDLILCIDAYFYFGTDDLYLNELLRFLKPDGRLAIAGAGLMHELPGAVPEHLRAWWEPNMWCLHSAEWWKRHWEKTGFVSVQLADTMPEGWKHWLAWQQFVCPGNTVELQAIEADAGRNLGYVRVIASRNQQAKLDDPIGEIPTQYVKHPLLRAPAGVVPVQS